ncbi:hypothetical protein EP12_09055 [Alteromonas australica]|uniref:DUF3649 domain-containing protein n=1 Tax=Alteromonas australica TaxID=589873 RepID=A0A075NW03_9ALTE|nr:hypothetical protein [Alteromonas australica]MAB92370.1 hypothetical protein [Alteromonas sp.]AIF98779.1 hypothetical protein EP13_08870 [Alteromonas australica]AJP43784.1 hypothetical protein EP12_09055 [Alteromonas australica]MAO31231.1 hypothetical protein [Alteromonas sp.]MBU33671.1 hypothetical protein [Alteromonas sp.]
MKKYVEIWLRSIAAIVGGYAVSALSTFYLTYCFVTGFSLSKGVAVLSACMLSYFLFFAIFIISFAVANIRAWSLMLFFSIVLCFLGLPYVSTL